VDARLTSDQKQLAALGVDGTAGLWLTDDRDLFRQACQSIGRNLTTQEWVNIAGSDLPYQPICADFRTDPSVYQDLIIQGKIDQALAAYTKERESRPALPDKRVWLVQMASDLLRVGQTESVIQLGSPSPYRSQALALYARALALDPALAQAPAAALRTICDHGSLPAATAEVLRACERLVERNPEEPLFLALRGRARAKLGDRAGALEDLGAVRRAWAEAPGNSLLWPVVEGWLQELEAGGDPFAMSISEHLTRLAQRDRLKTPG
jgi:tetratricopeptide (TPR) repeat protein